MSAERVPQKSASNEPLTPRRSPRFPVSGRIRCESVTHNIGVALLNVSEGGFYIRSSIRQVVGDIQKFRFTVESEREAIFVLRGRAVHCVPLITNGTTNYLI